MRKQTSRRNPPSTNYQRPAERKFFIWQDRHIDYSTSRQYRTGNWERHPWRWMCTLCEPPSYGFRARKGAQRAILTVSLPRHMLARQRHHQWVRKHESSH